MVNPGGESTMLGHWRIVLRQAEEAARAGRFEEAHSLATRPDVADHHHAVVFRGRLALDLVARATRRGSVDDLAGAVEDLDLAARIGAPPDSLAAARLALADRATDEIHADLDAGEPVKALERIEQLAQHKITGPSLSAHVKSPKLGAMGWPTNGVVNSVERTSTLIGGTLGRRCGSGLRPGCGSRCEDRAWKPPAARFSQGRGTLRRALSRQVARDSFGGRGRARACP